MARVTIEDCLDNVENRFALVLLATRRARQLMKGAESLVSTRNKEPVTALREIADRRVTFDRNIHDILQTPVRAESYLPLPPAPAPASLDDAE